MVAFGYTNTSAVQFRLKRLAYLWGRCGANLGTGDFCGSALGFDYLYAVNNYAKARGV